MAAMSSCCASRGTESELSSLGIRYVVDAGRSKQRLVDSHAGLARFQVAWISQSGAAQRAGRSGRTGPGHCYRSLSSFGLRTLHVGCASDVPLCISSGTSSETDATAAAISVSLMTIRSLRPYEVNLTKFETQQCWWHRIQCIDQP